MYDYITEVNKAIDHIEHVEKYNPYHGKDGRFTSANGGGTAEAAVSSMGTKYRELIPADSYMNEPKYRESRAKFSDAVKAKEEAVEKVGALKEELKSESSPKPREEWTVQDEINSMLGNKPMSYTARGKEINEQIKIERQKMQQAEKVASKEYDYLERQDTKEYIRQSDAMGKMSAPTPATKESYKGFADKTNIPAFDEKLQNGKAYVAEMSPKEYLQRCSYEIFNSTMESTIKGTSESNIKEYTRMMNNGVKFDMPYLNYASEGQEGRHRALAAYNLGIEEIPVLIIRK